MQRNTGKRFNFTDSLFVDILNTYTYHVLGYFGRS